MSQKPTIGRIVQYGVGCDHTGVVQYRPALVVNDWNGGYDPKFSGPNLQVFVDGTNDTPERFVPRQPGDHAEPGVHVDEARAGVAWRTSVVEGDGVGQWRWPPRD